MSETKVSMLHEMKVLHVTLWPGPPFSGANINCLNFLKRLTPHHRARFVVPAPYDVAEAISSDRLADLGIPNEGVQVIGHRRISLWDRVKGILLHDRMPYPGFVEDVLGGPLRQAAGRIVRDWNPDVMVVWFWGFADAAASVTCPRRILYACDSLSLANLNQGRNTRNIARRVYHRMMAKRCRALEESVFPQYDEVVFISRADAEHARLPSSVSVSVIGNGVEVASVSPTPLAEAKSDRPVIVFHGFLGFLPNAESVRFLVKRVGRHLQTELGDDGFELRIIGGGATSAQRRMAGRHPWLKLEGYVEDLHAALSRGAVYVAPLTMGAGVTNKVLDAMSCGLPVVGTESAFRGLAVTSGTQCLISELEDIPANVLKLVRDSQLRRRLGAEAREWVVRNADWDVQARLFDEVLRRKSGEQPTPGSE